MTQDTTIARLDSSQSDAFRALRLEALRLFPAFYGTDYADAVSTSLSPYARRIETGLLFGAFQQGLLVGCLAFDREVGLKQEHRGWITSVYVQPGLQRAGIGRRMMEAALGHRAADGLLQVELYVSERNHIAKAFYERLGFEVVGRAPRALRLPDGFVDELHMIKRLDGDG